MTWIYLLRNSEKNKAEIPNRPFSPQKAFQSGQNIKPHLKHTNDEVETRDKK